MGQALPSKPSEGLQKALLYMEVALELLDKADAPTDIGAHLDLALCRLRETLSEAQSQVSQTS
jgi:hypothetical protein